MISVEEQLFEYKNLFQKEYNLAKLLIKLDNVQNLVPTINIVGTNGKGSTSFYVSKGLLNKYKKVGLFISPAFLYHNERIQINNQPISDTDLMDYINIIKNYIDEYDLTFFEIWTLIAILYFKDNQVDIAVVEAGMGGIMDTTNLFNNQVLVGLTSVSYDHMEILGNTINEIIYQKVNILKENKTLIISNRNQEYLSKIKKQLLVSNYELIVANKYEDAFVEYQKDNMGLAKEILKYLDIVDDSIFTLSPPNGRFTRFEMDGYEVIIDGAHNVDGIKSLIQSTNKLNKDFIVLYASINTKDYLTNLKLLKKNFNEVYITEFINPKSWKLSNVRHDLKVLDWKDFLLSNKKNILICGSLYFIPAVFELYENKRRREQ